MTIEQKGNYEPLMYRWAMAGYPSFKDRFFVSVSFAARDLYLRFQSGHRYRTLRLYTETLGDLSSYKKHPIYDMPMINVIDDLSPIDGRNMYLLENFDLLLMGEHYFNDYKGNLLYRVWCPKHSDSPVKYYDGIFYCEKCEDVVKYV